MRSILEVIAPNVGSGTSLNNYKNLSPYLATNPLTNVRFGLSGGVNAHFLFPSFFISNRFGTYVLRNGERINNYFAIVNRFRIGIPLDDQNWHWMEDTTLDLGIVTTAGGARLRTRAPGGVWQEAIAQPAYYRSRFHCAAPTSRITLHLGQWTEVEMITNISDGSSALFQPITYVRTHPQPGESLTYTGGAYAAAVLIGGFTWGTSTPPAGVPFIDPDLSACGQDYYHPDDPQLSTAPPGAHDFYALAAKNFFGIPKELMQVTTPDAATNGNLPYCNTGD